MIDLMKKSMLTGIGAAILTKEKIEEIANDFVERGKLSEQEGEKIVQEMLSKTEESKRELKKQIEQMIKTALGKMQLASAKDIEEMRAEIKALRKEIESLRESD